MRFAFKQRDTSIRRPVSKDLPNFLRILCYSHFRDPRVIIFPTIIIRSSCTNHIVISTQMICSRIKRSISVTKTHLSLLLWFPLFICTNKSLESVGLPEGLKVACWEWFKGVRKQRTQQHYTVDYTGVESHL